MRTRRVPFSDWPALHGSCRCVPKYWCESLFCSMSEECIDHVSKVDGSASETTLFNVNTKPKKNTDCALHCVRSLLIRSTVTIPGGYLTTCVTWYARFLIWRRWAKSNFLYTITSVKMFSLCVFRFAMCVIVISQVLRMFLTFSVCFYWVPVACKSIYIIHKSARSTLKKNVLDLLMPLNWNHCYWSMKFRVAVCGISNRNYIVDVSFTDIIRQKR